VRLLLAEEQVVVADACMRTTVWKLLLHSSSCMHAELATLHITPAAPAEAHVRAHLTRAAGERAKIGNVRLQRRAGNALAAVRGVQLRLRRAGVQLSRLQPE
jgi:hypothetical protein